MSFSCSLGFKNHDKECKKIVNVKAEKLKVK
jgi:hypothetical protein